VGHAAVRGYIEDWHGNYGEIVFETEEILDLGGGIIFSVMIQDARLAGSHARVQQRYAAVYEWVDDKIFRVTAYSDFDEARAAAERLALERADG